MHIHTHVKTATKILDVRKILGRWKSRKHQESVSPARQQLYYTNNLYDITISELRSLVEGLQLPGEDWKGKLLFISVNFSSALSVVTAIHLPPAATSCPHVPVAVCT